LIVGIIVTLAALVVALSVDRSFVRYITKRKRVEEVLREQKTRYRTLVENIPQKIFHKDRDSTYISCNENYARDLKIESHEIVGKDDYEFYPKQLAEKYRRDDKRIMESGRTEDLEEQYIQDGEKRWVHTFKTPVKDEDGNITGILGIFRDITERKKLEEGLKESEEKWRSLTENTDDTVVIVDKDDVIQYINKTIPPETPEEVIGKTVYKYVSKEHHQVMRESLKKVYQTGKPDRYEVALNMQAIDPKIGTLWYSTNVVPIKQDQKTVSVIMVSTNITERKKMEEEIKQRADEWQRTFDSITDLVFIQDKDLRFIRVNKAVTDVLKAKPEDLIGKTCYEVLHKRDKPWSNCPMAKVFKDEKTHTEEIDDPNIGIPLLVSASPIFDEKGKIIGGVHVAKDITERKKMEEALKKQTHDLGERVKELNCLYGLSALIEKEDISLEEILKGAVNLISSSWQYPKIAAARIILEGQTFKTKNFKETPWKLASDIVVGAKKTGLLQVVYLEERPEGDEGPFLKEERHLINALGEHLGRIIERKEIERDLRIKSEAIESSINAIALADLEGRLTYVNRSFLSMWRHGQEREVLGRPITEFWGTEEQSLQIMQAVRSGEGWVGELAAKREDGSTLDIELMVNMVENTVGKAICMVASVVDITERKRIEQMKDDFVALASHELRTPLTSIQGYTELILDGDVGEISGQQRKFLKIIVQNTRRLEALINEVLDIEKIESGRLKMKLEKVNLCQIVEDSLNTFKVTAQGRGLELTEEIKEAEINVLGDSDRLSQVFANLLSNAIKYTKEGRVKVTAQKKGKFASVAVEDTGIGMSPQDAKMVFDRFFRVENSYVKKTTGTGLGLSIVKATIERHNGHIKVESKLGVGSKFEVMLPLLKEDEEAQQ
ncbi:PAS domain S-box protein, partial [Candidatus Aerophobetes bacterium]